MVIWAIAVKDMKIAFGERMSMIQAITLPVNYLVMMSLFVLAGSNAPAAVVMTDHGSYARQFVAAMERSHTFRITVESQAEADAQMQAGTLVAEVTIPADFDQVIEHHQRMMIPVMINNLNEDLTTDAHRGIRLALASFYAAVSPGQVPVTVTDHDTYSQDTGYIPFLALSIVVIALMVAGMLQAGNAAAREYEQSTIKGLFLAPVRSWQILAGRILGAFIVSLPAVAVVLAVVVLIVGDRPDRLALAVGVALLTLAVFCAAGVALGTITRDRSLVAILTRAVPVPLFFLSGVFAPLSFQTGTVQAIGEVLPVHWAVVLTQFAFKGFLTGTVSLADDAVILAGYLAVFVAVAAVALRQTARVRSRAFTGPPLARPAPALARR
jgi:ABC-type transport system involved in multi-copper enzyme maturation permease subunit